jgi:hypothetical protein
VQITKFERSLVYMTGTMLTEQRAPCENAIRPAAIPTNVRALGPPRGKQNCPVFPNCIVHRRTWKPEMRAQQTEVAVRTEIWTEVTNTTRLAHHYGWLAFVWPEFVQNMAWITICGAQISRCRLMPIPSSFCDSRLSFGDGLLQVGLGQ